MSWWSQKRYVSVAQRRANAACEMEKLQAQGKTISPVQVGGRQIARTFWGKAWCDHIEHLADFESRLPKGRTYVRNGSVCHLEIRKGRIEAYVCGSDLYEVAVDLQPLDAARWEQIKQRCAGRVGTALELLQGKFSDEVMQVLTDPATGMFPSSDDFDLDCSCADFVRLCKHLAAVLYGVGARLDQQPELLFLLRGVDPTELVEGAIDAAAVTAGKSAAPALADSELSEIFGIDIDLGERTPTSKPAASRKATRRGKPTATKGTRKHATAPKAAKQKPSSKGGNANHL